MGRRTAKSEAALQNTAGDYSMLLVPLLVVFLIIGLFLVLRPRAASGVWPMPTGRQIKILAWGDSITGNLAESGSAGKMGEIATTAGYPATSSAIGLGGHCTTGAGGVCKGFGGLLENMQIIRDVAPDVVMLNVGTNDFWNWSGPLAPGATKPEDVANTPAIADRISVLVDEMRKINPNILVLITNPTEKQLWPRNTALKAEILRIIGEQNADGGFTGFVDAYANFDVATDFQANTGNFDNVHITNQGATKMALNWGNGLVDYIKNMNNPSPSPSPSPTTDPSPSPTLDPSPSPSPSPEPTISSYDANIDGIPLVGVGDLSILIANYGKTNAVRTDGDLDANGTINVLDLSRLIKHWGLEN